MKALKTQNAASASARAAETKFEKSEKSAAAATHSSNGLLTREDLSTLKAPFTKERLGVKVQSFNKERTRAMLVLYLQHTDVQDRLEEVDPAWSFEILGEERYGDTYYAKGRITVKGVSRENVGEGGDPKAAYSDALKRCAMLFGIGRYLYDSDTVWTEYNDSRDRFKSWSVDDYEAAARPRGGASSSGLTTSAKAAKKAPPAQSSERVATPAASPRATAAPAGRSREELNRVLMNLYRPFLTQFPQTQFAQLLQDRYNVAETRLMTVEQLEDLVQFLEQKLQSVA